MNVAFSNVSVWVVLVLCTKGLGKGLGLSRREGIFEGFTRAPLF